MGTKFYVYARRRWREVDTENGNVEGMGRGSFLYLKQGRLNVARRGVVLRALRALATGCVGAVRDGLPLSKYVPEAPSPRKHQKHHSCRMCETRRKPIPNYCMRCANDERFDRVLKADTSTIAVQCVATADAGIQVSLPGQDKQPNSAKTQTEKPNGAIDNRNVANGDRGSGKVTSEGNGRKRRRSTSVSSEDSQMSTNGDGDNLKELIIEESDVQVLRRFLVQDGGRSLEVDVDRFDRDDSYKETVFYAINPLVSVERCPRINKLLQQRRNVERTRSSSEDSLSLQQFMNVLGLRTVGDETPVKRYKTRASIPHHDKENVAKNNKNVLSPKKPSKVLADGSNRSGEEPRGRRREEITIEISSGEEFVQKPPVRKKRSLGGKGDAASKPPASTLKSGKRGGWREYSGEEDVAILQWVAEGGRSKSVKGNRIWKEMQRDHKRNTGIARSWHSLKNRYLRHVLPALPRLTHPQLAQRLRADAHTGELRRRKCSKENSLLLLPAVRSAWSRRPRRPSPPSGDDSVPVRRTPRLSQAAPEGRPPKPPREGRRRLFNPQAPI